MIQGKRDLATCLYWLEKQNMDGLIHSYGKPYLSNYETELRIKTVKVAHVSWVTIPGAKEYVVPLFDFEHPLEYMNGNQLSFWVTRCMEAELSPSEKDCQP